MKHIMPTLPKTDNLLPTVLKNVIVKFPYRSLFLQRIPHSFRYLYLSASLSFNICIKKTIRKV